MRPGAGRCSAVSGLASGVGLVLDVVLRAFWVLGSGSWVAHHGPLARSARSARRQQHNWQLAMSFRISRHLVKRVSTRARCPLAAAVRSSRQQTADSRHQTSDSRLHWLLAALLSREEPPAAAACCVSAVRPGLRFKF
jgi:hypothetical protein